MPKLLHTLCCCVVRPKKSASKKLSNNNNNKETGNSVVVVGNNNGGGSGGGGGKSKGKRNKKRDYYDAVNEAASARQQPTRSADDCWNGEQTSGTPASQVAASSIITQVSKTGNDASTSNAISNSPTQTTTISNNNNNNNVGKNNFKQNAKRLIGLGGKSSEKATAAAAAANASPSADAVPTLSITSPTPANNNLLLNNAAELSRQRERLRESVSADVVQHLLPRPHAADSDKKCLIVDLDETLVHSSFKPVKNADFVIPVEIDNVVHQVYVLKRPHADEFLERVGSLFECVLFTASLAKYADPVADLLDRRGIFRARLFREACVFFEGNYVKDLDRLGRQLEHVVIIDNSPASYAFHPFNAVAVRTWFDDPHDTELLELLPVLEEIAKGSDVYSVLGGGGGGRNSRLGLQPQVSDAVAATTVVVSTTTSPSGATTITTTTTTTTNIAVGRNPRYNNNNNNNNYQQQHKMNYDPDTAGNTNNNYYGAMPLQSSSPISSVSNNNNSNNNGYGSYYGSEREHQQQRWKNNNNNNSSSYAANQRYYGSAGGSGTPTTQRGPTETTVSRTIELTRR